MPAISIIETELSSLADYRFQYLQSLPFAQEFFVEGFVKNALCYEIRFGSDFAGYALINEKVIVEFFLVPSMALIAKDAMATLFTTTSITSALCKSFDKLFVECCSDIFSKRDTIGCLYRSFDDSIVPNRCDVEIHSELASFSDVPSILSLDGQFFCDQAEIMTYFEDNARLFKYTVENDLVGCGIIKQVVNGINYFDIGYFVASAYRGKGIATFIALDLKKYCIEHDWSPIAGCSIENIASQKTLQKAGFKSAHSLLKFVL